MGWDGSITKVDHGNVTTTEKFAPTSGGYTLGPRETMHFQVYTDSSGASNDKLQVQLYATLDTSTERWDDIGPLRFEIDNDTGHVLSFLVSGYYKVRIGVKALHASDTWDDVETWHRGDGVSL